jgi:hypothetical protein
MEKLKVNRLQKIAEQSKSSETLPVREGSDDLIFFDVLREMESIFLSVA